MGPLILSTIVLGIRKNGRTSNRAPKATDTCFNCGKLGHWYFFPARLLLRANECRLEGPHRSSDGRDLMRCFGCGRRGHRKRDCKYRKSESKTDSRSSSGSSYSRRRRRYSESSSRSPSKSRDHRRRYSSSRSPSRPRRRERD